MKAHRLLVISTVALALISFAQNPNQRKLIKAKDDSFAIYFDNVPTASIVTSFAPGGDIEFKASGTRLYGHSKEQGLTFSMNSLEGRASGDEGQPKRLKFVKASGKVSMDVDTSSADGSMLTHIETEMIEMNEKETEAVFTIEKPFLFTNRAQLSDGNRFIELRAPSAVFTMPTLGEPAESLIPFKSASVAGPVTIKVVSSKKEEGGESSFEVNVRADKMTFSSKDNILRLSGNIEGEYIQNPVDRKGLGIEMDADHVLIFLDEDGLVYHVQFVTGVLQEKDGGSR